MAKPNDSFNVLIKNHLDFICSNSTCHGGNWALKISSERLKLIFQTFIIVAQIIFLCSLIHATVFHPVEVESSINWQDDGNKVFPKITICNQRIFDAYETEGNYDFKHFCHSQQYSE